MAPRSSGPGGEFRSPPGRTKPPAHSKINTLTETEVGESRGATVLGQLAVAQLQAAWVSFGKQRRVTSGERRSRFYPLPNFGSSASLQSQNYRAQIGRPFDPDFYYTTRIDHRFSDKSFLFGRWTWNRSYSRGYAGNLPTIGQLWQIRDTRP